MLPGYIIEDLKRREQEKEDGRPRVHIRVPLRDEPRRQPEPEKEYDPNVDFEIDDRRISSGIYITE